MNYTSADSEGGSTVGRKVNIIPRSEPFVYAVPAINPSLVKSVIVHHAAAKTCTVANIWDWHRKRGWAGAGYNFFVRKNGEIHEMRGFSLHGTHAGEQNGRSMGVCVEGSYDIEKAMPSTQMESLALIIHLIFEKFPALSMDVSNIKKHSDFMSTACPGGFFPWSELRTKVAQSMALRSKPYFVSVGGGGGGAYPDLSGGIPQTSIATYIVKPTDKTWNDISRQTGVSVTALIGGLSFENKKYGLDITKAPPAGTPITYTKNSISTAYADSFVDDDFANNSTGNAIYTHTESVLSVYDSSKKTDYRLLVLNNEEIPLSAAKTGLPSMSTLHSKNEKRYGYKDDKRGKFSIKHEVNEYEKLKIFVKTKDGISIFMFKIDPTQMSESRNRMIMQKKTQGGYVIVDNGSNPTTINLSGVMLEYSGESEKMDFLSFYKSFIESGAYKRIYMFFDGTFYSIEVSNVGIVSSGNQGIIKNYSMSIFVLNDTVESLAVSKIDAPDAKVSGVIFSTKVIPGIDPTINKY